MTKPTTVDEYLDTFSSLQRERLAELRALSRRGASGALESIKWGSPAYVHETGVILFMFSGHKAHMNIVFTPSTREAFANELQGFDTGKGSVKLPYSEPVPTDLLARMIEYRIREYEHDGVMWM